MKRLLEYRDSQDADANSSRVEEDIGKSNYLGKITQLTACVVQRRDKGQGMMGWRDVEGDNWNVVPSLPPLKKQPRKGNCKGRADNSDACLE